MIWSRLKAWIARLFRREPAPGRWLEDSAFSLRGFIGSKPWLLPRRRYRIYLPRGFQRSAATSLVVLIHGCRQHAEEFARGTRIETLADRLGIVVLAPEQDDRANPFRCWNWFDARTAAGRGEAALVAEMLRAVQQRYRIDPARTLVAGLSSGAALAAVLGIRHPSLLRSVVTHSGIAAGAAATAFTAISVMGRGPETDVAAIADEARRDASGPPTVTLLAIQGLADDVVASRHGAALVRQYLAFNGVDVPPGAATTLPPHDRGETVPAAPGAVRLREWQRDGRPLVRLLEIEGLGHAWSGGDSALPFNEAAALDATAAIGDWLGGLAR